MDSSRVYVATTLAALYDERLPCTMKGYLVMAYTLRIPWKEERYFLNKFAMKFSYVAMELSRRCTRHRVLSP